MNLEIANRLVALRKDNNLSQEALAEKLGISRQAVSKWERAEASPDTDNLIALARLYHISLDELLKIHEEEDDDTDQTVDYETDRTSHGKDREDVEDDVHVGFDGVHVRDKNGEVHVSWRGIHVYDRKNDNDVHIDGNGIYVNGDEAKDHIFAHDDGAQFPLGIIAIVVYIAIGVCFDLWHPGWLIFLLVPIIGTLIGAIRHRNANLFAYPLLALFVFLYAGLVHSVWHPTWVVFLTIPLYYSLVGYIKRVGRRNREENEYDKEM